MDRGEEENIMTAYSIDYRVGKEDGIRTAQIDARDIKSAKKKIGRKYGYKTGNMIKIEKVNIIGYF